MNNIRLKGFSIVKLLVFLGFCALCYFVLWPLGKEWYFESQYEKMNNGARMVYEAAESYCEGKSADSVESIYCKKFGTWDGNVKQLSDQIDNRITNEFDDCYYTVIIQGGKVQAAYVAKSEDSSIVGSYPDESSLESHVLDKLSDSKQ